jgi:hypothetical protein
MTFVEDNVKNCQIIFIAVLRAEYTMLQYDIVTKTKPLIPTVLAIAAVQNLKDLMWTLHSNGRTAPAQ